MRFPYFALFFLCCWGALQLACQRGQKTVPAESPQTVSAAPRVPQFTEHLIMNNYAYPYGIAAADLDGDGDLDLTSSDACQSELYSPFFCVDHNNLYWFENLGRGNFTLHLVQKSEPERLERHDIGDINRDGHPDIAIVENKFGSLLWFENSGTPRDGKLWKRRVIAQRSFPGAYDVDLADLDGDGDLDLAASGWTGNQFAWFENSGAPASGVWQQHTLEANVPDTRTIRAVDFDKDGDLDLLGTISGKFQAPGEEGLVVWYENSGNARAWKRHIIDRTVRPLHGQPVDMDGDGDSDVVMASGMAIHPNPHGRVVWYENPKDPREVPWKKHVIQENWVLGFDAAAADLDRDGDIDVVATGWGKPGQIAWFENKGDPRGKWTMHTLKEGWRRATQVLTADLDGDSYPDIAAVAERGSLEFRWWRNEASQPYGLNPPGARSSDARNSLKASGLIKSP